jgi:diadenosine tetraphosphate (Ap4A) HIT family hydrolase
VASVWCTHKAASRRSSGPVGTTARDILSRTYASSRLRLQREQHVPGWCVLLLRRHVREPHELSETERSASFDDMVRVGRALEQVYASLKINYSILGNSVPHVHAHIQPRYYGDPYPGGVANPAPGQSRILTESDAREQILRIRAGGWHDGRPNNVRRSR